MSWKQAAIALAAIVIFGTGIRFFNLDNNAFVSDEFLDMNSAYGYAQTGEWKAWDFNFGKLSEVNINVPRDERAVVYKWQVAQLFHILPPTETVARTMSVLWGAVSMAVVFWAAFVLTKRREIALLAAFFFAVSVSGIVFDRTLRMYAMFFPVYLVAATCVFLALEQKHTGRFGWMKNISEKWGIHGGYLGGAIACFILSLFTHQLTGTLVFSTAVYLLIRAYQEYRSLGQWRNKYSTLLILGVLGVITIAIFFPKFFRSFAGGLIFFDDHYGYIRHMLRDYYHPLLALLLLFLGGWWIAKREHLPKASLWLATSFLVPLVMAIWLWRRNIGAQYIFFAQSFVMILMAAGVFGTWRILCEKWNITDTKKALIILSGLFLLVPNFGYFTEENNTYHETSSGSNPNYRKVFTYFKKNQLSTDVLVTRNVRNYYFAGANVPVYDLGDEISKTRLSREELETLMAQHSTGWVILSDNDYEYVSKEAEDFIEKNLTRVSNAQVRGAIDVFMWGH